MKKTIMFLAAFSLSFALAAAQPAKSTVRVEKMTSSVLGVEKEYSVYLPAGYDSSGKDYPVLYLLHGAWGTHNDWVRAGNMQKITDRLANEGMVLPMIIVMPDARGEKPDFTGERMGYFNRPGWNYEDFFFSEFIPHIEKTYRVKSGKKHRAISGLSMGGGGSMAYALRHPEMFGSACPLSGLLANGSSVPALKDKAFVTSVDSSNAVEFIRNATEETLAALRTVRWYIDCGDDDFLYEGNVRAYMIMREKHIPLQYRMRDGGHDWEYWQSSLPDVLQFVSTGFAQ